MDERFLTKYEKKILKRNSGIIERFKNMQAENPEVSPSRIIQLIAEEVDLHFTAVYRILLKNGCYERRYNTRKSA